MEEVKGSQHSSPVANISRRIVGLHKEFYGKGPTKAKTYYHDDVVVVLMRGGFTKVEETLLAGGRGQAVAKQRAEFGAAMRERFDAVIKEELGRGVIAFMAGSHQDPDLLCEVYVLEPLDEDVDAETDDPRPLRAVDEPEKG